MCPYPYPNLSQSPPPPTHQPPPKNLLRGSNEAQAASRRPIHATALLYHAHIQSPCLWGALKEYCRAGGCWPAGGGLLVDRWRLRTLSLGDLEFPFFLVAVEHPDSYRLPKTDDALGTPQTPPALLKCHGKSKRPIQNFAALHSNGILAPGILTFIASTCLPQMGPHATLWAA